MGYSYTTKAGNTLAAIRQLAESPDGLSNFIPVGPLGGFYELGREQRDGAITGSVYRNLPGGKCIKAGTLRIEPSGKITRFFGLPKALAKMAEDKASAKKISPLIQFAFSK